MSYITAIGTAVPPFRTAQTQIGAFMLKAMKVNTTQARKLNMIFKSSGIHYRHSVLSDYSRIDNFEFYPNDPAFEPFPTTKKRLDVFRQHALPLSLQAIQHVFKKRSIDPRTITHLITVSCTGFYAPGLDIDLVKSLQLNTQVKRTCVNFMGCYAGLTALREADIICAADPAARVLVVCTELCSLHFQREPDDDNLLANALFADGAAAVLIEATPAKGTSLKPIGFYNTISFDGENDMAWQIGDHGFIMKLSAYIPELIQKGIKNLTDDLLNKLNLSVEDIKYLATHPGGKKILHAIEKTLGVSEDKHAQAYHILKNYGNMSSPTVFFVMEAIMNTLTTHHNGEYILSFAFGPGLTMESALLQITFT